MENFCEKLEIISSYPFELVGIDIVGPFKITARKNKYVLVCVDYFTNWIEAAPLKTLEAEETANLFFKLIITRSPVIANIFSSLNKYLNIKLFTQVTKIIRSSILMKD